MAIFDYIEKLITEHGSAAILREQVALARSEFAVLERKNRDLSTASAECKQAVARLEADNKALHSQVQNLQQEKRDLEKQLSHKSGSLDPTQIEILKLLSDGDTWTAGELAGRLQIHRARAEHFLSVLVTNRFVSGVYSMGDDAGYIIDSKGNEYLVVNGLD
jgi:chromosome segregation ATPase